MAQEVLSRGEFETLLRGVVLKHWEEAERHFHPGDVLQTVNIDVYVEDLKRSFTPFTSVAVTDATVFSMNGQWSTVLAPEDWKADLLRLVGLEFDIKDKDRRFGQNYLCYCFVRQDRTAHEVAAAVCAFESFVESRRSQS